MAFQGHAIHQFCIASCFLHERPCILSFHGNLNVDLAFSIYPEEQSCEWPCKNEVTVTLEPEAPSSYQLLPPQLQA